MQLGAMLCHHRDRSLLLPSIVEHTINESSPLYGMSHKKLEVGNDGLTNHLRLKYFCTCALMSLIWMPLLPSGCGC